VAKKNKKKPVTKGQPDVKQPSLSDPWISMRTGVIIIAITSTIMALLTGYQAYAGGRTLVDSILLGLFFGGLIWAIFFGNILINRLLRRKK
jgi:hypothetical protein